MTKDRFLYVDLGANEGKTIADWLEHHPNSQVLALEPNPKLITKLKRKFDRDPRVQLVEAAAGTEEGQTEFYRGKKSNQSGTTTLGKPLGHKYGVWYDQPQLVRVADTARLIWPLVEGGQRRVMKIDIEGAEYQLVPYLIRTGLARAFEEVRIEWHWHKFGIDEQTHHQLVRELEALTRVVPWK